MQSLVNKSKKFGTRSCACALRKVSVVAWGRNTSGQVGQGVDSVYDEPAILSDLEGEGVASVAAGRYHSAAVSNGVVWTWGCGKEGKLGHGDNKNQSRPSRVESLVGHVDIRQVALGNQHSLFLDSEGQTWSCGDNKQGQCGLGTPLQEIANQQRREWEGERAQLAGAAFLEGAATRQHSGRRQEYGSPQAELVTSNQQQRTAVSQRMAPLNLNAARETEMQDIKRFLGEEATWRETRVANDLARSLSGRTMTPTRLGSGVDTLAAEATLGVDSVGHVAASKYFSALATQDGGVYTFGGGYSGELGSDRSWESCASSVGSDIVQALDRDGGALEVAAGGTFCLALTHSGSVLLWGSLPGVPETRVRGTARVKRIQGLPPIRHIAAGHAHALMSDGERVWTMGRWLNPGGEVQHGGTWGSPEQILQVDGVASLAAGAHSSAVVSENGALHMWGNLLNEEAVESLRTKQRGSWHSRGGEGPLWNGLGSETPALVQGLGRVRSVALGFQHALAIVD